MDDALGLSEDYAIKLKTMIDRAAGNSTPTMKMQLRNDPLVSTLVGGVPTELSITIAGIECKLVFHSSTRVFTLKSTRALNGSEEKTLFRNARNAVTDFSILCTNCAFV